jgi:hypothetical protein
MHGGCAINGGTRKAPGRSRAASTSVGAALLVQRGCGEGRGGGGGWSRFSGVPGSGRDGTGGGGGAGFVIRSPRYLDKCDHQADNFCKEGIQENAEPLQPIVEPIAVERCVVGNVNREFAVYLRE